MSRFELKSSPPHRLARTKKKGLTLIELVVVLAILAAVAAIIVPLLPNLLRRAHKAIDGTQSSELSKAVQTYHALYYGYPDNFDMLTDGTAFPSYIPADGGAVFGGFVQASTLTASELAALAKVGVRYVQPLATTSTSPSLDPYPAGTTLLANRLDLTDSANATKVFAVIDPAGTSGTTIQASNPRFFEAVRSADPTARYVVFGVGSRSSMVGQTIQDAPTSVPQNSGFTPATLYSRVGVIFKVSGLEVASADNRARFIGAVALEDDELEATEKDIVGYYVVSKGTN